jgi:hypothetical protein
MTVRSLVSGLVAGLTMAALVVTPALGSVQGVSPGPSRSAFADVPCLSEQEPNERPEDAPVVAGEICLAGTLPEVRDQDLVLWEVPPPEALTTWRITVEGIPTTITSVWVFEIASEPGVFPPDTTELLRVDSDATSPTPGVREGVSLDAGQYLLGIARGAPADGSDPPPAEYRVTIEHEGDELPPNGDVEPNDDPATAAPVTAPFALTGTIDGNADVYRWTLSDADAASRWQVDLQGAQAGTVELALQAADGTRLASARTDGASQGHLYDLALPAGEYDLVLSSSSAEALGYLLAAAPVAAADAGWDPEPNDLPGLALPVAIGEPRIGRLAGPRDIDRYALTVSPEDAADQLDVGIAVGTDAYRQVCLTRLPDEVVGCRAGRGDVTLSHLLLTPGDYGITIDGDEDLEAGYELAVTDVGTVTTDREVEPNDRPGAASPFDPAVVMRGRSANGDVDYYRIPVAGEPQVWRLDVEGSGIGSVQWVEPDLEVRATADVSADGTSASLWDMTLIPGEHWIAVETTGEDYTLALTPLGPRAEGTEREPNGDRANAEPITIDEPRTGRVPAPADTDVYRFSLDTTEHLAIRLDPPSDGAIRVDVSTGNEDLARARTPVAGASFVHVMELFPGDYEIELQSDSGSTKPYTLTVTREDPYVTVADLEPNDVQAAARPVPPSLRVSGRGFGASGEDDDWYVLPPLTTEAPVTITATGDVTLQEIRDEASAVRVDADPEGGRWTTAPLPAGTALRLNVTSTGDYTLAFSSDGLPAAVADVPLPVEATLEPATTDVAAYTEFGQRVSAILRLANTGDAALALELDGVTTNASWTLELPEDRLDLPAGGSLEVPLEVVIAKDAWADIPVRTTVRVRDDAGRSVTAAADITPRQDVPLVAPEPSWAIPEAMLGGLDVASLALGATTPDSAQAQLHDGHAMTGIGFSGRVAGEPLELTVDLATDDAVPVAGMIVNPLSQVPALSTSPRRVELLLSDDGAAWTPVLDVELSTRLDDQPFPLPEPVPARFAQLRVHSTYGGPDSYVGLGEWQVIASPDWATAGARNIADPVLGGHMVSMDPGPTDPTQPEGMLSEAVETRAWTPWLKGGTPVSWVIGFQDDRAAQVTELGWVDPVPSDPAIRFTEIAVAVSSGSALGPWEEVGTWRLDRAGDGSVAPFPFEAPTWARFIRFTGDGPPETGYWEMPAVIRALERPTDAEYRSILGSWGRDEPVGIYERLVPPDPSTLELSFDLTDGNDTPETATPLTAGLPTDARTRRGEDVDWYELTVPPTDNILDITLRSRPDAGLVATLEDAGGVPVEMDGVISGTPGEQAFTAEVQPGATYRLRIEQAPLSTVFTYDSSGSMGAYLSYVSAALRGFAADVTKGEEAVKVMPFGDRPLLDHWSDDAYEIENAVAGVAQVSGTSAGETSLIAAANELGPRTGARAILAVTDGETSSYASGGDLWLSLDDVRPVIFTIHVAGGGAPALSTDLMQDWAASWGGRYEYASSHAQIDRAFDRLATWFRRPAAYSVAFTTRFESKAPGSLALVGPSVSTGSGTPVAGTGVAVEILLDTSGSMLEDTQGGRRIDVAKDVLTNLVTRTLPAGVPTALRIFKPGKGSCESKLLAPLAPLDPAAMAARVEGLKLNKRTKTPIAATLQQVAGDLGSAEGLRIIVLITDGEESCGGDPAAVIRELVAQGLDVRVNIVGFDIDDEGLRAEIEEWARLGNGQAFDATGAEELEASIGAALAAPFRVLDEEGAVVATGVVGGDKVELPPGTYRVEVLSDPVIVLEAVEIPAEQGVRITVEQPAPPEG